MRFAPHFPLCQISFTCTSEYFTLVSIDEHVSSYDDEGYVPSTWFRWKRGSFDGGKISFVDLQLRELGGTWWRRSWRFIDRTRIAMARLR